jgi:hypothetical protein
MKIEIESWPEPGGRPEPDRPKPEAGPAHAAPPAGGRWRVIHVVLSEHDAATEQVTSQVTMDGRQDA